MARKGGKVFKLEGFKEVGEALRLARVSRKESGSEAATAAGLNQGQVSKLERGAQIFYTEHMRPRVEALGKHLGVQVRFSPVEWDEAHAARPKPARRGRPPKARTVTAPDEAVLAGLKMLLDAQKQKLISPEGFILLVEQSLLRSANKGGQ